MATKSFTTGGGSAVSTEAPKSSITRDEWIKALAEAGYTDESDNSAVTLTEFAQMLGIPSSTAGMRLAALVRSGKAVVTKKVTRNGRGHRVQLRAYRLLRDTP